MEGPPLGPGGEDITWPDQVAPCGRKASSTRKIKPQTSNLSTLLRIPYPDRGMAWRSIQSVFTRLFTRLLLTFLPPRICASVCCVFIWTVFPPPMRIEIQWRLESPYTCSYIRSSLDQYLSTDASV